MSEHFKYTRKARTTRYKGIEFRSELEAAWSAFCDRRSIKKDYEPPLDLASWRPDFSIKVDSGWVLAEVKPYRSNDDWKRDTETLKKICDSFLSYEHVFALLLGISPLEPANFILTCDLEGNVILEEMDISDERTEEDWNWARNEVRWKP